MAPLRGGKRKIKQDEEEAAAAKEAAEATAVAEKAAEGDGGAQPEPAAKKAKTQDGKADAKGSQAPDAAEVMEIAQTQNLYKSNLFRMQLEELLKEIGPKPKYPKLENFLRGLQPLLRGFTAKELPEDFEREFPALRFHQRQPHPFSFKAPRRVDVVGSFLLGTFQRSNVSVDLALEIPSEAFASKDYLNFRYSDKRAAYVGEVHRQLLALQKSAAGGEAKELLQGVEIAFGSVQGDAYRPCVVLRPSSKAEGGSWRVRLLPTYAADLWPARLLGSDRNAVRPQGVAGDAPGSAPTPHYNCSVLEDGRMRQHLETLHKAIQKIPSLKDAILLLRHWAVAKSFMPGAGSVGACVCSPLSGLQLSMLAAHAGLSSGVAPAQTSSFQLFKLALSVLSSTEWATHKVVFGKSEPAALSEEEKKAGGAHFYDGEGILNFFWRLGPFMSELGWEAQRALKLLDSNSDPYDAVFGKCGSPELHWDILVRTPPLGAAALCPELRPAEKVGGKEGDPAALLEARGGSRPIDEPTATLVGARLAAVLTNGLGDRCHRSGVRLLADYGETWTSQKNGKGSTGPSVLVGLTLEASNLERFLDRGPTAESPEAPGFRALWGPEKAELRRFKDGSILECAVWARVPPTHSQRQVESKKHPAVVTQIVRHLVMRHFPDVGAEADLIAGPLGFVPSLCEKDKRLWGAFEAYRTHLCQLSALPLTIKDVHPVSAGFSYSESTPRTAPIVADGVVRALHSAVVEFESSGRWPDDPQAARKVCAAMLLQMQEQLQTDFGIESGVTEEYLDIRYPEFVFRTRIFHQYEHSKTANRVTNFQASPTASLPEAEALDRLRQLWWRPRIRTNLHAHVLQKPAMAGALRLFQRWLATQMLSGFEDFAEHIIASVFLQPLPFETPTSAQVGLCRALWLVSSYDWQREPLVIDFDGKLNAEERLAMRCAFEAAESERVAGTLWIASRYDPHSLLLPRLPATASVFLRRRAKHALATYHRRVLTEDKLGSLWQELFALDSSVFDVVIRLAAAGEKEATAATSAKAKLKFTAMPEAAARFVAKLKEQLSPVCLVFHDAVNHMVALKWRPGAFLPQQQHVLMGSVPHTMIAQPSKGQPICVPNVLLLTSTVAALAEGLSVEVSVSTGRT
eukprot:TRINITY_DN80904_c0_g1_i1.p1 TRINITY_DN80904_c0_g1~~TRINITY_DN80904_c0_g1_i1.p1  ORF type:complete len:1162 (+),score=270.84 TRINITY_DN80904_c0_g1_i1:70-3486(+)